VFGSEQETKMSDKIQNLSVCVRVESQAVAAFNLFLQLNCAGPLSDDDTLPLQLVNPHASCFADQLHAVSASDQERSLSLVAKQDTSCHNSILSEPAVDGVQPRQALNAPCLVFLARCLLSMARDLSFPFHPSHCCCCRHKFVQK
jgi:hypothetical protein